MRWRRLVSFFGHNTTADERYSRHRGRARRVFRDLKANLEDQRDYPEAGDFYYAEMELRRRQAGWFRKPLLFLYWLVSGYGEKPMRSLIAFLAIVLVLAGGFKNTWFTLGQPVSWHEYDPAPTNQRAFRPAANEAIGQALKSVVLQQRGGYLVPDSPWAHHLTLLANIVGPIQLSLFFLAMRRRFRR
jgi:hypothetical protein